LKQTEKDVKMRKDGKTEVVDTIPVPVYETLEEAKDALGGETGVLKLVNTQNATNLMNTARAGHKPTTAKGAKLFDALYDCMTTDEALEHVGSAKGLREFLFSEEIQARYKAKQEEAAA